MLFFVTKSLCINKDEAPESIIAKVEMDEKCPKNEIGILKCCPWVLPVTTDDEIENEEEIEKEEILFWTNGSDALAACSDRSKNPACPSSQR